MRTLIVLAVSVLSLSACGIGDGAALADLSDSQLTKLCEEYPERMVTCGEGELTVPLTFGGDCEASDTDSSGEIPSTCTVTAGDYRACYDAVEMASDDSLCEGLPSACSSLFDASCIPAE